MTHPTENDLVNFARDELGDRKKERIIEHCKQCHDCADRLIEATREHGPDPGPIKLSRFNKLSILFLILTLIAAVGGMMWFLNELGNRTEDFPAEYSLPDPEATDPEQPEPIDNEASDETRNTEEPTPEGARERQNDDEAR